MNKTNIIRLNLVALKKLISGNVSDRHLCVVKFYSDTCHLCHKLSPTYFNIANNYVNDDIYFFAFNTIDGKVDPALDSIEDLVPIKGVPSFIKFYTGDKKIKLSVLEEPENPDENTWYTAEEIIAFINKKEI